MNKSLKNTPDQHCAEWSLWL